MKTNNDMLHGGKLKPEYFQTWADYFVKYIKAYDAEGIKMWGLTVQNEALATQVWEFCVFTAEEERDFVKNFLGPALHKAGLADVKLMKGSVHESVMFPPDAVRPGERAGPFSLVGLKWGQPRIMRSS
jgi:glucosylceramidase